MGIENDLKSLWVPLETLASLRGNKRCEVFLFFFKALAVAKATRKKGRRLRLFFPPQGRYRETHTRRCPFSS